MKNNNTPKRRAAAPRSAQKSRPHTVRRPRSRRTAPFPLVLLLVSVGLLGLVASTATYNARRAAPPPVEDPDHLILNEVCADDQTLLTAPDGNRYSWVELYNPTAETISLKGWTLSNKKTDLYRYSFPKKAKIAAGERKLVYCVGSIREDFEAVFQDKAVLHADFAIGRGDSVCLCQKGVVVDLLELPGTLHRDTSYGRAYDGAAELAILDPTPDESNNEARQHALVELPAFSAPSGFYDEGFQLSITAPEGCTVYYTLDSSVPTTESTPFTEPIAIEDATSQPNHYCLNDRQGIYRATPLYAGQKPIYDSYYCPYLVPTENVDKCTVVRAVAVDGDGNVSDVATASYFVNFEGRKAYEDIPVVSLVSDPDGLFGDEGILVAGGAYEKGLADGTLTTSTYWDSLKSVCNFFRKGGCWERSAHMDYFDADRTLSFTQETGIRNHGNASRKRVPKAFSLYAREKYDGRARFQKPLFDSSTLTDKVYLVNAAAIRRYLLVNRMDGRTMDTQQYKLVQLFLDGEYWGFYAIQEAYNADSYLEDHYGLDSDDTILLKSNSRELINVTGTTEDIENEYNPMMEFVGSHDMTKEENWEKLNTMMDVQSFADFYAANFYLCNMDFNWHHNVYLFKTRKVRAGNPWTDGRWHWMLYDVDYSTGDNPNVPADHTMFRGYFLNHRHGIDLDPMFPYLAKNEHFRALFVNTYLDIANDVYGAEEMSELLEQHRERWREAAYATVLRYPLKDDADSLNAETHASRFLVNCDKLSDFFQKRFDYDVPQMANYFQLTGKQVNVTLQGSEGGTVTLNTLTPDLSEQDWQGVYYTDIPVVLRANPEPGMKLDHWETSSGTLSEDANGDTLLTLKKDTTVRAVFAVDDSPEETDSGEASS